MSGKRVLALYAAILFSFAVILCRLYFLAQNQTYGSPRQSAKRGSACAACTAWKFL